MSETIKNKKASYSREEEPGWLEISPDLLQLSLLLSGH